MKQNEMLQRLRDGLAAMGFSAKEQDAKLQTVREDMAVPVKLIGIGQCGVGKTELLRSIFRISEDVLEEYLRFKGRQEDLDQLVTGSVKAVTKVFFSFTIKNPEGFRVQFTDGPGLGESGETEMEHMEKWVAEIPKHDLLYWVLDGSSRDIKHVQENMKYVLDRTGYREKFIVVLNKIDQILLPLDMELKGVVGWDTDFNRPSKALNQLIEQRMDDLMEKLERCAGITREQMVACSARRRWHHDKVLDKMLEYLPDDLKIKLSRNREVKDHTELMSPRARRILRGEQDIQT
jgi:predicted GTPase